jgi:hypothetical protein
VHMLTAVVGVQDLHGRGQESFDWLPAPLRPIAEHAQADLVLRAHSGLFHLPQSRPHLVVAAPLLPAHQLYAPLLIHQVEAKALRLLPCPRPAWPACSGDP